MKYFYSALVLLLALFLAAFIQQNGTSVQLKYFFWSTPYLPVSLYMILCFAFGYALAVVVGLASGIRFRFRATVAEKEVRQLRSELDQLKKEEVTAIRSEYRDEPPEPVETVDKKSRIWGRRKRGITGDEPETGVQTVILGSGGEEEK